jgi:hypothetical protein
LPGAKITLRNGARVIEKTWPADDSFEAELTKPR